MEQAIKTSSLTKLYGTKEAVSALNMNVKKGDIYGFIGRNGSGKSTTLKMLAGLAYPTQGNIQIFGKSILEGSIKRRLGVLIENAGFDSSSSAYENMYLKAVMMGLVDPDREIRELLESTGLDPEDKKKVSKYSMGMKQRLGIALALLGGPDLLLLDEPINGLDPEGMNQIRRLLIDLNQKKGITILVSSHILGELSKMATRYGILRNGRLVREISREELESECRDYLYLKVSDEKKASALLEEKLLVRDYEVRPQGEIRIFQDIDSSSVAKLLTGEGISISAIYIHQQDLEEYFLELMGKEDAFETKKKAFGKKKGGKYNA